jgi:2-polyprenyl-3-methyl-5-hydroxy-6-metoxy-1,4-benzoquinol methylase
MPRDATSDEWERLGRVDPYWAVLSEEAYRRENLSDAALDRFLQTGEDQVEALWRTCRAVFGDQFAPARVLDFGCGVGRVTLPLSRRASSVVGVDVAASMLAQARQLLDRRGITNVTLVRNDDDLASLAGPFDLVHSAIVLQHIPVERGLTMIRRLIQLAGDGGVVALHVLYANPHERAWPVRLASRILRPLRGLRGRPPHIEMNAYPLNAIFRSVHDAGSRECHVELTNHAGHLGATLLFRTRPRVADATSE